MKTTNQFIAQQCDQAGEIVEFDCAAQPVKSIEDFRFDPTKESIADAAIRFAAITQPVQPADKRPGIPGNVITHRPAWRQALQIAMDIAVVEAPDRDDKAYWAHELAAFDRTFDRLWEMIADSAAQPVQPASNLEDDFAIAATEAFDAMWASHTPEFIDELDKRMLAFGAYMSATRAAIAIRASATSAPEQPGRQSFGEQYPHNPDAKCKCEHWEVCTDCHPKYIKATPQPAEGKS